MAADQQSSASAVRLERGHLDGLKGNGHSGYPNHVTPAIFGLILLSLYHPRMPVRNSRFLSENGLCHQQG